MTPEIITAAAEFRQRSRYGRDKQPTCCQRCESRLAAAVGLNPGFRFATSGLRTTTDYVVFTAAGQNIVSHTLG